LKVLWESGEGGIKESSGRVNPSMIYLIHCKNLCKCYSVPLPSTTIKRKTNLTSPTPMVYLYNPSYSGGSDQEDGS
jgi:hypothetical protein